MRFKQGLVICASVLLVACKQAQIDGPVAGGSVTVEELRQSTEVVSNESTFDEALAGSLEGWEEFEPLVKRALLGITLLNTQDFDADTWYLMAVAGGEDYGSAGDIVPAQVFGGVHALLKGSRLDGQSTTLSPLTEAAYRFVKDDIDSFSDEQLQVALDDLAPQLVGDVDADGVIDYADVLSWNRLLHNNPELLKVAAAPLDSLTQGMRDGVSEALLSERAAALFDIDSDTNSIGMSFKNISGGSFRMGDLSGWGGESEKPARRVRISPFQMGVHEVTVGQFKQFIAAADRDDLLSDFFMSYNQHNDHPVVLVSWEDAQAFIAWLNKKEGGNGYRLPTEAEWEYAARAGTSNKYSWGDSDSQADDYAWYYDNSGDSTHAVGGKRANPWGLYDMHGNAWEWVQDWFDEDYYANSPSSDPQGPDSGRYRVFRGGGWSSRAGGLRSAHRVNYSPGDRVISLGFRLVRQP